jgi:pSer/pThr/pTyr-binding forkhead associated (FHA) protein
LKACVDTLKVDLNLVNLNDLNSANGIILHRSDGSSKRLHKSEEEYLLDCDEIELGESVTLKFFKEGDNG